MTYFNGTLQEFTYLHEQVTEISNPDESYLGTLNLFFKEPVTSNDEQTYFEESDAFEQYVKDYINNNIIQLQELNGNGHYIANDNGDTIQVHFNDYSLFHYHYSNWSVLIPTSAFSQYQSPTIIKLLTGHP